LQCSDFATRLFNSLLHISRFHYAYLDGQQSDLALMRAQDQHTGDPNIRAESPVERELRWLINNTDEPFLLLDRDLQVVTFNRQFEKMYQLHFGVLVKKGIPVIDLVLPERRPALMALYQEVLEGAEKESVLQLDHADGSYHVFESRYRPARDEQRRIIGIFITAKDVTEQLRAKRQLENTLHSLNERVKEQQCLYRITRLSHEETSINRLFEKAVSLIPSGLQHPEIAEASISYGGRRFKTPDFRHVEQKLTSQRTLNNGETLLVEAGYLATKSGGASCFLTEEVRLLEGIADMLALQVEQLLARALQTDEQRRYVSMFQSAPALICIVRAIDLRIEFANPFFEKAAGMTSVRDLRFPEIFGFDPGFDIEALLRQVIESGKEIVEREVPARINQIRSGELETRYINLAFQPYRDPHGNITGVIIYGIDLSMQVHARKALADSEQNYRTVFEENPQPIWVVEPGTLQFLEANKEACRKYGYSREEFLKMSLRDIRPAEEAVRLAHLRWYDESEAAGAYQGVWRHISKTGRQLDVQISSHQIIYAGKSAILIQANDITERMEAERALAKLQTNQEALINNTNDLIWSVDNQLRLITANRAFIESLQASAGRTVKPGDDLIMRDVFPDEFLNAWVAMYERGLSGESFEAEIYTAAGEGYAESWAQVRINPIKGPFGIIGIACYSRDITVSRNFEKRLISINQKLETAQQIAKLGYWELDMVNGKLFWTDEVFEIWGVSRQFFEPSLDTFIETMHPDDRADFALINEQIMEQGASLDFEHRVILPNGEIKTVREKGEIIRNEQGVPIRLEGTVQDITEQVKQLNEIIAIQQNLDTVINSTSDMIWSVSTELELVTANTAFQNSMQKLLGREVKPGDRVADSGFSEELIQIWTERYRRALAGESYQLEDAYLYPGDREKHFYIMSLSPVFHKDRTTKGVVCYARDITALKRSRDRLHQLNQQLVRKTEELVTSNIELERFAYVASHDLQEPLRMVSSFLQLLDRKYGNKLDDTAREYVRFAVNGADKMKRLIQDLLDYSRLDSGRDELGDTDMNQIVQEVIYTLDDRIKMRGALIEVGQLPVLSDTNRTQMFQLIQNLVNNGLKYNEQSQPIVRIDALEQADHWLFTVNDNGIGIEPRFFDRIFVVFQRLHSQSQYNGTGIGLSVCKKIVERAGGNIWVESALGQGSTFSFTIPKKRIQNN
jgi:PAS domain S-box-containing protein